MELTLNGLAKVGPEDEFVHELILPLEHRWGAGRVGGMGGVGGGGRQHGPGKCVGASMQSKASVFVCL